MASIHPMNLPRPFSIEKALAQIATAQAEGKTDLLLVPQTPREALDCVRLIQAAKETAPALRIDVQDGPVLSAHPKLRQALVLAGCRAILPAPTPSAQRTKPAAPRPNEKKTAQPAFSTPTAPDRLSSDYIMVNEVTTPNGRLREAEIRVTYRCNEACPFCWARRESQDPPLALIENTIRWLAERGLHILSFSGGEPTLRDDLPDLLRLARKHGALSTMLLTNGMRLADPRVFDPLVEARLDHVFLSLHAHNEDLNAEITGVRGAFDKTLAGLRNVLRSPLWLSVNVVMTRQNLAALPDLTRLLIAEAQEAGRGLSLMFSFPAPIEENRAAHRLFLPRLSALRRPLIESLDLLKGSLVRHHGFATNCAPPLCSVAGRPDLIGLAAPAELLGSSDDFVKARACAHCSYRDLCMGLRKAYAETFGTDELEPF